MAGGGVRGRSREGEGGGGLIGQSGGSRADVEREVTLPGTGRLEQVELRLQHPGLHEVVLAGRQPLREQLARPGQVQEGHVVPSQHVAIPAREGGAGDHDRPAGRQPLIHPGCDGGQPRRAVLVGERRSRAHPLDIRRRMEAVALQQVPAESFGEQGGDR